MGVNLEVNVRDECLVGANKMYMCGNLTCPLHDDSSGYMVRMCAVLLNSYKRQLLAVLPQFNFSLLQGYRRQRHSTVAVTSAIVATSSYTTF